jgi:hypothetical protein
MRKQFIGHAAAAAEAAEYSWLDLEHLSEVRLSSEDPEHPLESAFKGGVGKGWRAAQSGTQTIWLNFDAPQPVQHINLRFEAAESRTQEFVLLASVDGGATYRDLVRQQFTFSEGARYEEENYFSRISGVTDLKLIIVPDISGGDARATLQVLRIR